MTCIIFMLMVETMDSREHMMVLVLVDFVINSDRTAAGKPPVTSICNHLTLSCNIERAVDGLRWVADKLVLREAQDLEQRVVSAQHQHDQPQGQ